MFDKGSPLWLPPGSVRAILALVVVLPIAIIALRSNIVMSADQLIGLVSFVLGAYFIQKAAAAAAQAKDPPAQE